MAHGLGQHHVPDELQTLLRHPLGPVGDHALPLVQGQTHLSIPLFETLVTHGLQQTLVLGQADYLVAGQTLPLDLTQGTLRYLQPVALGTGGILLTAYFGQE